MMARVPELFTALVNWLHKHLNNVNNMNGNITTFIELLTHLSHHGYQLNPRQNLTGLQDLSGLIFQGVAG